MEAAGLISRQRSARDERQVIISLTQAGRDMRKEAAGIMSSILCATQCSKEEALALKDQLVALRDNLEKSIR
jgi:DNA-binding MarR family transcriptional regulator